MSKNQSNIITLNIKGKSNEVAFLSDLHWDNPKCNRKQLKKDLDYCLKNDIPVFLNGDTLDLMQGKTDRRGSKSDILPEHNKGNYFDAVVETAVEWFAPYAHIIFGVSYGNHETAPNKHHESDLLRRWVREMNLTHGSNIQLGGYSGWIIVRQELRKGVTITYKGKYHHGLSAGGIVTRGIISLTRALEMYEDFDFFTMGHTHTSISDDVQRDVVVHNPKTKQYEVQKKNIHMFITGTYKDDYGDGSKGWAIERGMPPKQIGGKIAKFQALESNAHGIMKQITTYKFPL